MIEAETIESDRGPHMAYENMRRHELRTSPEQGDTGLEHRHKWFQVKTKVFFKTSPHQIFITVHANNHGDNPLKKPKHWIGLWEILQETPIYSRQKPSKTCRFPETVFPQIQWHPIWLSWVPLGFWPTQYQLPGASQMRFFGSATSRSGPFHGHGALPIYRWMVNLSWKIPSPKRDDVYGMPLWLRKLPGWWARATPLKNDGVRQLVWLATQYMGK